MRRPVGVKWVLGFCWSRLFLCRVAAVAMLPSALELYLTRFIQHAVPTVAISQIQSDGQFLLRNIPALRCCSGANAARRNLWSGKPDDSWVGVVRQHFIFQDVELLYHTISPGAFSN